MYVSEFTIIILVAFGVFRLARMVTCENGPGFVFEKSRQRIASWASDRKTTWVFSLGDLVTCEHCLGVWLALLITLLIYRFTPWWWLNWLAIAGMQSAIASLTAE